MIAQHSDITKALDEIIAHEEGFLFQRLATLLAKQKWPDLIASEPKKDLGADARASGVLAANGQGKILACSLTAELAKIRHDASEVKLRYPDTRVFIFATPRGVSNQKQEEWKKDIRASFEFDLVVLSREEIVSSLMEPQNVVICRTILKIPVEIEPDLPDLIRKIACATFAVTSEWFTQRRLADQPLIDLRAVRLGETERPGEAIASTKILDELTEGRRIVIEAPAGRGKTTSLIQFAKRLSESNRLAFVIDLPEWAKSGRPLNEYIAGISAFISQGVDARALVRASNVERFILLFNGWNELSENASGNIERELRKVDREFPTAGIVVATRTHSVRPPFAGAMRLTIPPLNRAERTEYLTAALADHAQELIAKIEASQPLDELTRTPLILREVTRIFSAGRALPTTKGGILQAVIQLMEEEVEHRNELCRSPLSGNATAYLSELATRLTTQGDVTISEAEARKVCNFSSEKLQSERQLTNAPQPGDVLDALCSHHVLERIDYPAAAFRFQHQQFQEFYAALSLGHVLASVLDGPTNEAADFIKNYMNVVSWDEPLRMIAENIGADSNETQTRRGAVDRGKRLIELALQVDPIFAAELARLAGNAVWQAVASMLGQRIRAWHKVEDPNHKQCALAAMFASGSADFSDVIISLLTSGNQGVRLEAYRVWPDFQLSSLGPNWQKIVSEWKEDARIDFVSEVTINQRRTDVAEYFAFNDQSIEVRIKAIEALSWIGARNQVTWGLENLPQATLGNALLRLHREDIPPSFLPQTIAAYRDQLASLTDPIQRIRLLLAVMELGETDVVEALKGELIRLPTGTSGPNLRESLEIVRKADKQWVSEWVGTRIITDSFWHESWIDFDPSVPETLKGELLQKISTENLNFEDRKIVAVLSSVADVELAGEVFSRLCTLQRELDASVPTTDQMRGSIFRQLEDLFRSIPPTTTVLSLSRAFSEDFDSVKFRVITKLLSRVGREESDLRSELPEDLRQGLRCYLKAGISFAASQDDVNGELLANLASSLARVGDREDMADLAALIQFDLKRFRGIREAISKGERFQGVWGWFTWHLQAVMALDREQAETIFLPLLNEEGYDVEAAKFLLKLATFDEHKNHILPAKTDFGLIWKARNGESPTNFIEDRRRRFSTALKARVSDLFEQCSANVASGHYSHTLPELAVVLAAMDSQSSSALVLQVIALPGRWNSWRRVEALKALFLNGVVAPAGAVLNILNLVIEEVCKDGIYVNDQEVGLLKFALCLLPFVDNPAVGISRLREVLAKIRLPPHELADIISALGHSRSPDALALLRELAESDATRIEHTLREWIDALAKLNLPESKEILLSFLNPQEDTFSGKLKINNDDARWLASRIVNIANADILSKQRILRLLSQQMSAERQSLLLWVIAALGTSDVILAALPTMTDSSSQQRIPYELWRAFENLFLEHRPHGTSTNAYTVISRPSNEIRAQLLNLVLNDPLRRRFAFAILGKVEVWHLENGKPDSEPRHPAFESGMPWPPLEIFQSDTA